MKTFTLKVMEPLSWLHGRPSSGRQLLLPVALFVASSGLMIDNADGGTHYVWQSSPSPAAPFTNWTTAATSIQEAVDVADAGDEILVTNGVYATGGRALSGTMTNRVTVNKALTLRSINGPQVTIIEGYQVPGAINGDGAIRCVYLTNGAGLSGFTLRNGATTTNGWEELSGGGVW